MFKTLTGFRDFYPKDCFIRNHIFKVWRNTARLFNFSEYDTPVLEPLELFTTKSGPEIVSQLFAFKDQGERQVALRPELTPSMARLVAAQYNSLPKPIKWFTIGENFRYERPQKGRLRSFYQFNCDIIGDPSPAADAEVIALLIHTFTIFGLSHNAFCIRLSDRLLWTHFLQTFNLSSEQIDYTLTIIDKLERDSPDAIVQKLTSVFKDQAQAFYNKALELASVQSFSDLKAYFEQPSFSSQPSIKERLQQWTKLLDQLSAFNLLPFIKVDLSVVRGLAYYTGFVFEAFQTIGKGRALAGGGRYDNLIQKLGGVDAPATGWAMGDVTLMNLLEETSLLPPCVNALDVFIAIADDPSKTTALSDVSTLRHHGFSVEYSFKSTSLGKQLKQADQLGARFALIYGSNELASNNILAKDLLHKKEHLVSRETLIDSLKELI